MRDFILLICLLIGIAGMGSAAAAFLMFISSLSCVLSSFWEKLLKFRLMIAPQGEFFIR